MPVPMLVKVSLVICLLCIQFQNTRSTMPYIKCLKPSPQNIQFSCLNESYFLHVMDVEIGITSGNSSSSIPFSCAKPLPDRRRHCLRPAGRVASAYVKECGVRTECGRTLDTSLGKDVARECSATYNGPMYIVVNYACLLRKTSQGVTLRAFEMLARVQQVPTSALFLTSPRYSQLTTGRLACNINFRADSGTAGQSFNIQIFDFFSVVPDADDSAPSCSHELYIVNNLGSEMTTASYCPDNVTSNTLTLEPRGVAKAGADGSVQVVALSRNESARARLWIGIEVLSGGGSIEGRLSLDCSPSMDLLASRSPGSRTTQEEERSLRLFTWAGTDYGATTPWSDSAAAAAKIQHDIGSTTRVEYQQRLVGGIATGVGLMLLVVILLLVAKWYKVRRYRNSPLAMPINSTLNSDPGNLVFHIEPPVSYVRPLNRPPTKPIHIIKEVTKEQEEDEEDDEEDDEEELNNYPKTVI